MNNYSNLIAITNRQLVDGDFTEHMRKVASLHPHAIILREKDIDDESYEKLALSIMGFCREEKVPFYIHGRVELAKRLGCKNIHIPVNQLEDSITDFDNISVSCHSLEDIRLAEKYNATQIILGTIFATDCKPGLQGRGAPFVREMCKQTDIPIYAIGGIKPDNIDMVMEAGAAGGCMMSGFMKEL